MVTLHHLLASPPPGDHQGSPLPAARVVVIAVPTMALLIFWWLRHRGRP